MEQAYTKVQLDSWKDYKEFIGELSENWAFRGQASASWILSNAIERTEFISHSPQIEREFVSEFQRGARNYLSRDEIPEHLIEWLALMQHHGAPTRLLDLTRSPFIAAYFAYEQALVREGQRVGIWGINVQHLRSCAMDLLRQHYGPEANPGPGGIDEALFEKIFYDNQPGLVFPVEPFRMNRRYSLQQSIFLSTGISHESLMHQLLFLGQSVCRAVVRIELPACEKKAVLRELQLMNLNRASLFPDLDGYALSLRLRYNSRRTPAEALRQNVERLEDRNYPFIP